MNAKIVNGRSTAVEGQTFVGKGQNSIERDRRRIAVLVYPGMVALDMVGPVEAFNYASRLSAATSYDIVLVGENTGPQTSSSSIGITPHQTFSQGCEQAEILLIPGMMHPEDKSYLTPALTEWVRSQAVISNKWVCICSGIFVLAETGLVDTQPVTTHWNDAFYLRQAFPALDVKEERIFVQSGKLYSSGGVTAGIDLALHIITEDCGKDVASRVAKRMLVYLQRSGDQRQFSSLLQAQSRESRFHGLINWIEQNLHREISVELLSDRTAMSPRNFSRAFKAELGCSPMAFVIERRLETARLMLESGDQPISSIANACGFRSLDQFGKAFGNKFSVSPRHFRERFNAEK